MMVLITYDVATDTPIGRKRLRRVAKACEDWGKGSSIPSSNATSTQPSGQRSGRD